ncbi:MAG TPA: ATP-dependent DNA helicase [Terriglobales bacterium]|jgi:DNA helicase-2/ATP-dependent DNA helicase PcrA|nr:ATP-dependent DNA helicase [Terriglobales bacterium]
MSLQQIQLDDAQRAAVEHVHGPMLVVAGAGTGKTTVLEQRIAHLIRNSHAAPDEILAVTYTEIAAKNLQERVTSLLASEDISSREFKACTFHAYCYGLLCRYGEAFEVLDRTDLWIYLRRNIAQLPLERFIKAANPGRFLDDLLSFYDRCRDELVRASDYENYVQRLRAGELALPRVGRMQDFEELSHDEAVAHCDEIARVYAKVEQMLAAKKMGTFGDMIADALEVLRQDFVLLEEERKHSRFILIDEFQDSNVAQIELAALLAGEERNVFAVGDPDQAIYRFRGATSGAFDEFTRRFPKVKRERLERNHRSLSPILQNSFAAISKNPDVSGWKRAALRSAREEDAGKQGRPAPADPVMAVMTPDICAEAADIADAIREHHGGAAGEELCWRDFAVLYRTHAQREKLTEEFSLRSIPFTVTGVDVLESTPIRDLLAVLRAIISSRDAISLFRVAALPQFGIGAEALHAALLEGGRDPDLAAALAKQEGGRKLLEAVQSCRNLLAKNPKATHIIPRVAAVFGLDRVNEALAVFREFVEQWSKKPITEGGTLAEFLNYLEFFKEARGTVPLEKPDDELDAVRLLTVHAAKGLEWKQVHVIRLNAGSFPLRYQEPLFAFPDALRRSPHGGDEDDKKLHGEEERRLLYVAMTRAADRLLLYARPGRGKDGTPDGFLRELLKDKSVAQVLQQRPARPDEAVEAEEDRPAAAIASWLELPAQRDFSRMPLSATAIESYKVCPLRFKIEQDWRLPGETAAAMQFGNVMHSVLKFYYDEVHSGHQPGCEAILRRFEELMARMPFEDPLQQQLYTRQGRVQLQTFLQTCEAAPSIQVLNTERTFRIEIGGVEIIGRVDRMDALGSKANRVVITDYKTGRPRDQQDADQSLQLSIYAMAAERAWKLQAERLIFHNLEDNSQIEAMRSPEQLRAHEEEIRQVARDIVEGRFEATPGFHCRSCAYFSLCPKTEQRLYTIQKSLQAVSTGAN